MMFVQVWAMVLALGPLQPEEMCFQKSVGNRGFLSKSVKLKASRLNCLWISYIWVSTLCYLVPSLQ